MVSWIRWIAPLPRPLDRSERMQCMKRGLWFSSSVFRRRTRQVQAELDLITGYLHKVNGDPCHFVLD